MVERLRETRSAATVAAAYTLSVRVTGLFACEATSESAADEKDAVLVVVLDIFCVFCFSPDSNVR